MEDIKVEVNEELLQSEEERIQEEESLRKEAENVARKHGIKSIKKIFKISVFDEDSENNEDGEWISCYVRKPKLSEFSMFTKLAETDKINALKTVLNTVFIEGDKKILEDDDCFMGAMLQVEPIMNVYASKIKKF